MWHDFFKIGNYETACEFMNDFFKAHSYIIHVMDKNEKIDHQFITYAWGKYVLEQKFNYILNNHILFKKTMINIYNKYIQGFEEFHLRKIKEIKTKHIL